MSEKTPKQLHGEGAVTQDANNANGANVAKMQRRLPRLNVRQAGTAKPSGKVNKTMQISETLESAAVPQPVPARKSAPIKQELVAPHEWASLLNNIESQPEDTHVGGEVLGEVELFSDD